MTRRLVLGASLALLGLAGCGGARGAAPAPAVLTVECAQADAALWIDERFVGEIREARGGVRMPPGPHRVEVRRDGYHAYYGEVALAPGERRRLVVELAARLD